MSEVTIVGGGIAGLTAAISCAEGGVSVTLHEAHREIGGRGRATDPPYIAHDGCHVFYTGGEDYRWLRRHGFVRGLGWPSPLDFAHIRFRVDGALRRVPPGAMLRAQSRRWLAAPVDVDFRTWASEMWDEVTAEHMANAIAVTTYHADTGALSAAFVWNLFQRVLGPRVPTIRWVRGGWQRVIDTMAERAVALGVEIETGSRLDSLPNGPTIVATDLTSAARLLDDDTLVGTSGDCVLLDFAVDRRRSDATIVFDLDEGGFHESCSMTDKSVAPAGQSLFALQMPVRSGESIRQARERLNVFAETVVPDWSERATFSRNGSAKGRTGAVDLPGATWRDRPKIDRGGDVYLAGDMVAAPGMRGEIAVNSALTAAGAAVRAVTGARSVHR